MWTVVGAGIGGASEGEGAPVVEFANALGALLELPVVEEAATGVSVAADFAGMGAEAVVEATFGSAG